jgi:predicted alpha/beta superfamily hydrolase
MKPTFKLSSPETGTDYFLYVEEPTDSPGPCPVVLFMDGDDQFAAGVAAYKEAFGLGMVAPLLLVGVGYGASYAKAANKRGRDYTPTAHGDEPTSGGAAPFLKFVTGTLWNELSQRYSTDPRQRGIAGHSLGSLFVLYAMLQEPLFFTHYLASAPSIWWDNRSILKIAAHRYANESALPAKLFLSVGEKDSESMTGDLSLLEQQLTGNPFKGLDVATRLFARRTHFNVLPQAFEAGLSFLFGAKT